MFLFLFRLLALLLLAAACISGVLDLARSVAASHVVMTPLAVSWAETSPATLELAKSTVSDWLHPAVWDYGVAWLLQAPGFVVFALLALAAYAIGHKPAPRVAGRFVIGE